MYNCNHLGVPVIKEALNQLNMPIVVIDDGSEVPVAESLQDPVFRFFNKRDRLKLIRHSENRGKGAAIQSALRHCAEQGYSHLLTVDGDGQHLISEVSKLIEASIRNPKDFIVGARIFDETVPGGSKFGRHYSNEWVTRQTGKKISDSQSGLRIYPVNEFKNIDFITSKYNFEFEALVRSVWNGMDIIEVPVKVYYPPEDERISHFNKVWDNTLIVLLNIYFVFQSLFIGRVEKPKIVAALIFGASTSFIPVLWAQAFIILFLSFCMRLNLFFVVSSCLFFTALMRLV